VAKMVLNDFLRGKIPWYIPDPNWPERKSNKEDETPEGGEGRLGEKRKQFGREPEEGDETETGSSDGLNAGDDCEGDIMDNDDTEGGLNDEDQEREEERTDDPHPSKRMRHR